MLAWGIAKRIFCFLAFALFMVSCKKETHDVYYNLTFQEISKIAKGRHKAFCIVLTRNLCPPCDSYVDKIAQENYNYLTEQAVFNIVNTDLPENRWYQQWLGLSATPATCIFDKSKNLISVVEGESRNSFDCIERSLYGNTDCAAYTYSPSFAIKDRKEFMRVLNDVLLCHNRLSNGENIEKEIDLTVTSMPYPYNLYLQAVNARNQGNLKEAAGYAERMLSLRDNHIEYRRLYADFSIEAKRMIYPDYDPDADAVLVADSLVRLDDCRNGESNPFSIAVANHGKSDLIIDNILTSCDCLTLIGDKTLKLKPGESASLDFVFLAEGYRGSVQRSVIIFSNAIYNPVEQIEINAFVKLIY